MQRRSHRPRHPEHVRQIVAANHHAAECGHGLDRRAQLGEPRTKRPAIVFVRHQRAAALRGAGLVWMVVGPAGRQREGGNTFALEQLEHRRSVVHEGLGLGAVQPVANMVSKVGECILSGIGDASRLLMGVDRNPDHARGIGGGPAEQRLLLDHDHIQPVKAGCQRGGKASRARPCNQDIAFALKTQRPQPSKSPREGACRQRLAAALRSRGVSSTGDHDAFHFRNASTVIFNGLY